MGLVEFGLIMAVWFILPALAITAAGILLWRGVKRPQRFAARSSDPELIGIPPLYADPAGRWYARVLVGAGAGTSGILKVSGARLSFVAEGSRQPAWSAPVLGLPIRWPGVEIAVGRKRADAYAVSVRQRVRLYAELPTVGEVGLVVSHVPLGPRWNNLTEVDENKAVRELVEQLRALGAQGPDSGVHLV